MIKLAWFKLILNAFLSRISSIKLSTCQNHIKISITGVEIMMPNLDSKHKLILIEGRYCKRSWICSIFITGNRGDDDFIESIDKLVIKGAYEGNEDNQRKDSSKECSKLRFSLVSQKLSGIEKVSFIEKVFYVFQNTHL